MSKPNFQTNRQISGTRKSKPNFQKLANSTVPGYLHEINFSNMSQLNSTRLSKPDFSNISQLNDSGIPKASFPKLVQLNSTRMSNPNFPKISRDI